MHRNPLPQLGRFAFAILKTALFLAGTPSLATGNFEFVGWTNPAGMLEFIQTGWWRVYPSMAAANQAYLEASAAKLAASGSGCTIDHAELDKIPGGWAGKYVVKESPTCYPAVPVPVVISRLMIECVTCNAPVAPLGGLKLAEQRDYDSPLLSFSRSYNSDDKQGSPGLGPGWTSNLHGKLLQGEQGQSVTLVTGDKQLLFNLAGDNLYLGPDGDPLRKLADRWVHEPAGGRKETYDLQGRLIETVEVGGYTQAYAYDGDRLASVQDSFRNVWKLAYANGRLSSFTPPEGYATTYGYSAGQQLTTVTSPDGNVRRYLYKAPDSHLIVGQADKQNVQTVAYSYDGENRLFKTAFPNRPEAEAETYQSGATKTVRPVSADGASLVPGPEKVIQKAAVTTRLGFVQTYVKSVDALVWVNNRVSVECADGCPGQVLFKHFDKDGNLDQLQTYDRKGKTEYRDFNARGLPAVIVEAGGTAQEVKTEQAWHSVLPVPVKVTRPGQVEDSTYNDQGQLLERIETDPATGAQRRHAFQYGAWGRLASETLPGGQTLQYEYDSRGNRLSALDKSTGLATRYAGHDLVGRVGTVTRPDGSVTAYTYDRMGRVASVKDADQLTQFAYDLDGQLAKVVEPSGRTLLYAYDAARRLQRVTEQGSGYVEYTRDGLGRVIQASTFDTAGAR